MGKTVEMINGVATAPAKVMNGAGTHKKETHDPMASRGEKNEPGPNVIQVPTWAITAFAVPVVAVVVWLTTFWTSTTYQLQALKETNEELRKDVRLQDAWLRETRELMLKMGVPANQVPAVPDISRPRDR